MGIASCANGQSRHHSICLRRNAASVNRQGCKPLEIALARHLRRNPGKAQPQ